MTAVALLELLNNVDFFPEDGAILHMLQILYFLKFLQSRGFCVLGLVDRKELMTLRLLENKFGHLSQQLQHSKRL